MTTGAATAVAVLAAGVKTPAGDTVEDLWSALCQGQSTAEVLEGGPFRADEAPLVCRDREFDPSTYFTPVETRRLPRAHALALAAAQDALAGCQDDLPPPHRRAVVCGVGLPGSAAYEEQLTNLAERGVHAMSPLTVPHTMPSSIASLLSLRHDVRGPSVTVSAACASGAAAIAQGVDLLRSGAADLVLAGGVDALLDHAPIAAFSRLDAMSRCVDHPELASRPFDVDRDGFVMGEGAGFVVLVRGDDARGRPVLGHVLGHASTSDAYHLVAPSPDGDGAFRCMQLALADAGLSTSDLTHVNAHGTSTVHGDLAEAAALARLFGGPGPPVTGVKGTTGHLIAGSGAVEAVVALVAATHGVVPPVAGLRTIDPAIDLDVVHGEVRRVPVGPVLSSSFGFGGANTVLVLGPD